MITSTLLPIDTQSNTLFSENKIINSNQNIASNLSCIYNIQNIRYEFYQFSTQSVSMDEQNNQAEVEHPTEPEPVPVQQTSHRRSSLYKPQFDWDLEAFDEQTALKNLSKLADENLDIDNEKKNPKLYIAESSIKSTALNKQYVYILRGEESEVDKIEIIRKYSDFYVLRETLVKRWPGCFFPPIPQKGNIGTTQKQISKNKLHIINSFLNRILQNQQIMNGQEFQTFVKSSENQVQKNLQKLKPHSLQNLYGVYKAAWPQNFEEINEQTLQNYEGKIKKFQDYFGQMKKDLANQKDDIKRLAQLRTKLTAQRYLILEKTLPEYEQICLGWFNGKTELPEKNEQSIVNKAEKKQYKQEGKQKKTEQEEQHKEEEKIEQKEDEKKIDYETIYSNPKYQSALQAYKEDLFPKQEGQNDDWLIYELFKFELRQIQAIIQAIQQYKYLDNERKYYQRNIQGNKQQLEDINNKKVSLKILLLSGSEDEKRTQLANETQILQTNYKLSEELWSAVTQHVIGQIQKFQLERCQFYKKSLMRVFKKQAIYMAKLFNLFVQIHKI